MQAAIAPPLTQNAADAAKQDRIRLIRMQFIAHEERQDESAPASQPASQRAKQKQTIAILRSKRRERKERSRVS